MVRKIALILGAMLVLLVLYPLCGGIRDTVTVEAGSEISLSQLGGLFLKAETDLDSLALDVPGTYPVQLRCLWRRAVCRVKVEDSTAPTGQTRDLTAFYTRIPDAADFLVSWEDATEVTVSYEREPDASVAGNQRVAILLEDLGGNVTRLEAVLTLIFDDTPPVITGVSDRRVYLGTVLDLSEGVTVSDDLDENTQLALDDSAVDWEAAGEYPVTYRAADACGNETVISATVTVIRDDTPPQIMGVTEISIYLGSTVAYRSGIMVTDDTDSAPVLRVDSSGVDLSRPGTYPVIYTASDCVGNTSVRETVITVREAPRSYVEADVILAAADRLLEKIIRPDMTIREQIWAIYDHLDRGYYYVNDSDKSDWMQAAYRLMQTQRGDCFSFYSLSRLLFDRLDIPNLTVRRRDNAWRSGDHWWSMVSLDGGESWYHYDSTPHMASTMETCLVTDGDLERFNRSARGYYDWDREAYPATPPERP